MIETVHRAARNSSRSPTLSSKEATLKFAIDSNYIASNPVADVRMPDDEGDPHEPWTWLEPQEQRALVECPKIPLEDRLLIKFALGSGLREGEMWNLELSDPAPRNRHQAR
jgi:integrase